MKIVMIWVSPKVQNKKVIGTEARLVVTTDDMNARVVQAYYANDEMLKYALLALYHGVEPIEDLKDALAKGEQAALAEYGISEMSADQLRATVRPLVDMDSPFPSAKGLSQEVITQQFEKFKKTSFKPGAHRN